jgi:hypothetical protein
MMAKLVKISLGENYHLGGIINSTIDKTEHMKLHRQLSWATLQSKIFLCL